MQRLFRIIRPPILSFLFTLHRTQCAVVFYINEWNAHESRKMPIQQFYSVHAMWWENIRVFY